MSADENKAIVRRYIEAINAQDRDAFTTLCTPEFAQHGVTQHERRPHA